ncbi:MAG TPA: energy transducer TonB, partial [Thermodesulfovibrionales bacterium]|nr:energy transducer TonB [Thermodesulfovibrionales bacterium]
AVPKKPAHESMPSSPSPQLPAPVLQPVTQSPSQTQAVESPSVETPAPFTPVVSLPQTNLPAGNQAASDVASTGSVTPPQFGAAYLNNPKPAYPALAKRMGMEGTVMLKVLVSREGTALKVEVAHSSGFATLDKAATDAVKNWRFIPARRAFQPVDEWVQVPVAFRLKK